MKTKRIILKCKKFAVHQGNPQKLSNCKLIKRFLKINLFYVDNFLKKIIKKCLDPGLNQGPTDLQSDALPTELSRLAVV